MKIFIKTLVENDYKTIESKFDKELFIKLSPPLMKLSVDRFDGCKKGDEVHLRMNLFNLLNQKWISVITASESNNNEFYFIDEGTVLPPPLKKWKHVHRVEKINETHSYVIDDIEYSTGNIILDNTIFPVLYSMFFFRKHIYQSELS